MAGQAEELVEPRQHEDYRGQLALARQRIESGDFQDASAAINSLAAILEKDPDHPESLQLVSAAIYKHKDLAEKVRQILPETVLEGRLGLVMDDSDTLILEETNAGVGGGAADLGTSLASEDESASLQQSIQLYYAGEYVQAIVLLERILKSDPKNDIARQYLEKAQDSMARGQIPEALVPFAARVSMGKAHSLRRAGLYQEAKQAYQEAQAIADEHGIEHWQAVEESLLDIEALALAGKFRSEGDALFEQDRWEEAIERFSAACSVYEGDTLSAERQKLVEDILRREKLVRLVSVQKDPIPAAAKLVKEALAVLARAARSMQDTPRLTRGIQEAERTLRDFQTRLVEQGQTLLGQAKVASSLAHRRELMQEGIQALQEAQALGRDTAATQVQVLATQLDLEKLTSDEKALEEVQVLVEHGEDPELRAAYSSLWSLQHCAEDPTFRGLRLALYQKLLDNAEAAIKQWESHSIRLFGRMSLPKWLSGGRAMRQQLLDRVERLLALAEGALLQGLGDQTQLRYVQRRLQIARQEEESILRIQAAVAIALVALCVIVILFLSLH